MRLNWKKTWKKEDSRIWRTHGQVPHTNAKKNKIERRKIIEMINAEISRVSSKLHLSCFIFKQSKRKNNLGKIRRKEFGLGKSTFSATKNSIMKNSIFLLIVTFFGSSLAKREIIVGKIFRSPFCQSWIFYSTYKNFLVNVQLTQSVKQMNFLSFFFNVIFLENRISYSVCAAHILICLSARLTQISSLHAQRKKKNTKKFSNAARCWVMKNFFFFFFFLWIYFLLLLLLL